MSEFRRLVWKENEKSIPKGEINDKLSSAWDEVWVWDIFLAENHNSVKKHY